MYLTIQDKSIPTTFIYSSGDYLTAKAHYCEAFINQMEIIIRQERNVFSFLSIFNYIAFL